MATEEEHQKPLPPGTTLEEARLRGQSLLDFLLELTSMESLKVPKKANQFALCPSCTELSVSWSFGKLKWREVEKGAKYLECPLCQILMDCLPFAAFSEVQDSKRSSTLSGNQPSMTHAVLKIGRLDGK